jgi:gamma-glutamyl:cysteine ligase YbdK (ATP-grasp superfamily)
LARRFQVNVREANRRLESMNAMLMPSAMHPWMDPEEELRLWPHEYNPVYEAFDRIFDCRGHGWANLQSMHVNLPFAGDEEFGRLHAAIRFLLPIMPALAASSPVVDARLTGRLDSRLEVYRKNTARIPSLTGAVIPEPVYSRATYEEQILAPIYRDLAPYDPEGILRDEWVNARGCIARFDRMAVEIRVLDVQECPAADLAVAAAIRSVLEAIVAGRLGDLDRMRAWPTERLASILSDVTRDAGEAWITDGDYAADLGRAGSRRCRAIDLWSELLAATGALAAGVEWTPALHVILERGCLARRLVRRLDGDVRRATLSRVFAELCDCLADGRMFGAGA